MNKERGEEMIQINQTPEQLAEAAIKLEQSIKQQQEQLKQLKDQLGQLVDNNKYNGSLSVNLGAYKITKKRNMNARLDKKELDLLIEKGYALPDGLIKVKEEVHKPTLTKLIESQSAELNVLQNFISVSYSDTVTITKKEDQ